MRYLVDTNVFLDYLLKRERYDDAVRFFKMSYDKHNWIYISTLSLKDIDYIVHRACHDNELTRRKLVALYGMCHKIIGISVDATFNALYSEKNDFEDCLLIESAKEAMLDAIITNNIKDFEDGGIPVFTPREITQYCADN